MMRRYWRDRRSILLAFAIFNFMIIWATIPAYPPTCVVGPPRYYQWSFFNEPTILLVAALFLRVNRWWGSAVALLLTGSLFAYVIYYWVGSDVAISTTLWWSLLTIYLPFGLITRDSQYLFALIVLVSSVFSLKRWLNHCEINTD